MAKAVFLSVVVPVYNEMGRIHNLQKICNFLARQKYSTELIVVNDGSTDDTLSVLKEWKKRSAASAAKKRFHFKILTSSKNRGKGYAVQQGMLAATGQWHLFTDLDLSVPLSSLSALIKLFASNEIIIGTRRSRDSHVIQSQSPLREQFGKVFTRISQIWLGLSISDFTCGFKCFSRAASGEIFSQVKTERWGFDSEVLFIAKQLRYSVAEFPVKWKNDPQTKVKFPQDIIRSVLDLIEIRYHFWRGRYK